MMAKAEGSVRVGGAFSAERRGGGARLVEHRPARAAPSCRDAALSARRRRRGRRRKTIELPVLYRPGGEEVGLVPVNSGIASPPSKAEDSE